MDIASYQVKSNILENSLRDAFTKERGVFRDKVLSCGSKSSTSNTLLHDIRNSLTCSLINMQYLRTLCNDDELLAVESALSSLEHVCLLVQSASNECHALLDLGEILNASIKAFFPENSDSVAMEFPSTKVYIRGNITKLQRIFYNILNNVSEELSYCSDGLASPPYINIEVQLAGKAVIVKISNYCSSLKVMSTKMIPTLIEKGVTTKPNNSGLGLFIVKNLVEQHFNGSVTYEYSSNTFTTTLRFNSYN